VLAEATVLSLVTSTSKISTNFTPAPTSPALATVSANRSPNGGAMSDNRPEVLTSKVVDSNNEILYFRINRTVAFKTLMDAFCQRQAIPLHGLKFLLKDPCVHPIDTPDSLDIQDGESLEVYQKMVPMSTNVSSNDKPEHVTIEVDGPSNERVLNESTSD
jgi:hypothetical protein